MTEQGYQSKIIKGIEAMGGVVVNGTYSKSGIADLICGWSKLEYNTQTGSMEPKLLHLHIEVKTKDAYERLFKHHITDVDGLYVVVDAFKGRERLQAFKLNDVRKRGGLALFAYSMEQVEDYVNSN